MPQTPLPPTPRPPRLSRSGRVAVLYGAMTVLAIVWGAVRGQPAVWRYHDGAGPMRALAGLAVGAALGLAVVALTRVALGRFRWARVLHREFRHTLGPLADHEILVLALTSAVGEELFFRGALVPHLGILASTAAFAVVHIGPGKRFLPWTAMAFVLGLALAFLFVESGSILGPVAAHFTINFLNLHYIAKTEIEDDPGAA